MKQGFTIIEFMVYAVVLAMLGGVAAVGLLPSRWARAEGAATFALAFDGDDTRITTGAAWMWGDWRIETALGWKLPDSRRVDAAAAHVRKAVALIGEQKFYEANLALKAVEDAVTVETYTAGALPTQGEAG